MASRQKEFVLILLYNRHILYYAVELQAIRSPSLIPCYILKSTVFKVTPINPIKMSIFAPYF